MELKLNQSIIEKNIKKFDDFYYGNRKMLINVHFNTEREYVSQYEELFNYEKTEQDRIGTLNQNMMAAEMGFDNIPATSFFQAVAYMMASVYGCTPKDQNGLLVTLPKYKLGELDIKEIIEPHKMGFYEKAFEYIEKFQEKYPEVILGVSDNQSPIDVFNLLYSVEDAMFNLYDYPVESKKVLENITKSIINVNRAFERKIKNFGGFCAGRYMKKGIFFSNDDAAYLSSEIYEEFAHPYDNMLSDEFGGISFHVCMKYEQNIENLVSTKNFVAFDCMPYYNNIDMILDNVKPNDIWNISNWHWTIPADCNEPIIDFYKRILDKAKDRVKLNIDIYDPNPEKARRLAEEVYEYSMKKGW